MTARRVACYLAGLSLWVATTGGAVSLSPLAHILEDVRQTYRLPALGGAVVSSSDVIALEVVGVREAGSQVEAQPDDRWHIGSITKSITATLALKLVRQDLIRFDTTVAEVLGERYPSMQPAYQAVTLAQLLGHRAGMNGDPLQLPVWNSLRDVTSTTAQHRDRLVADILDWQPEHAPGTAYLYSNSGYVVAGAMLESVTGKAWEELVADHVTKPLGLASAGLGAPGSPLALDNLRGHALRGGRHDPVRPSVDADNPAALGPAGTMHMSLPDLAQYLQAHLSSRAGYLMDDDLDRLHAPLADQDYGMGWKVAERDWAGGTVLTHTGSNTMWFVVVWLAPGIDRAFIAATNVGPQPGDQATDAAVARMIQYYLAN